MHEVPICSIGRMMRPRFTGTLPGGIRNERTIVHDALDANV
jgi:hypothetical protein